MNNLGDLQRLAIMRAMEKELAKQLTTRPKSGENFRTRMDAELEDDYYKTGHDRRRILVNGVECGTYSLVFSKAKDGLEPVIGDIDEFCTWLAADENRGYLHRLVDRCRKQAVEVSTSEGELPDGVELRRVAEPKRVKNTTITVHTKELAKALGPGLADAVAGVLAAGEGE